MRQQKQYLRCVLLKSFKSAADYCMQPLAAVALRIGVDLGIFKNVANSDHPVGTKALAENAKAEEELLCECTKLLFCNDRSLLIIHVDRIARFAGSLGYLDEVSPGLWGPTPLTRAMSIETVSAGQRFM